MDVFLNDDNGKLVGIQCKEKSFAKKPTIAEVNKEVAEAKKFNPSLNEYIIVTTAPNDAVISSHVLQLSIENRKEGLFNIEIYFWDDLCSLLIEYPDLEDELYGTGFNTKNDLSSIIQSSNDEQTKEIIAALTQPSVQNIEKENLSDLLPILEDNINVYKDLVSENPQKALEGYVRLKETYWSKLDENLKFRVTTNIGASHLNLKNYKDAAECFKDAFEIIKNEKTWCNLILAYVILEDNDNAKQAAHDAIEVYPESAVVYAYFLKTFNNYSDLDKPEELIPEHLRDDDEVILSIADFYSKKKEFFSAYQWIIKIYNSDVPKQVKNLYMYIVLMGATQYLFDVTEEDLHNAVEIAKINWEEVKVSKDYTEVYFITISNLIEAYRITHKTEELLLVLDEAITIPTKYTDQLKSFRLATMIEDNNITSDECLNYYESIDKKEQYFGFYIGILYKKGEYKEVVERVEQYSCNRQERERLHIELLLFKSLEKLGKPDIELDEYIEKNIRNNSLVFVNAIFIFFTRGNKELFEKYYLKSIETLTDSLFSLQLDLAHFLMNKKEYVKAKTIYRKYVNLNLDNTVLQNYMVCLYELNQTHELKQLFDKLTFNWRIIEFYVNLEASFFVKSGNTRKALKIYEDFFTKYHDSLMMRLNWINLSFIKRENEKAYDYLSTLNVDDYKHGDHITALKLCQLFIYVGLNEKALNLLYYLAYNNQNNFEIAQAYVNNILISRFSVPMGTNGIVESGTWLNLQNTNTKETVEYYILDKNEKAYNKYDINEEHMIYQACYNKKLKDKFIIQEAFIEVEYEIIELKSKYIHLLHQFLDTLPKMFPEKVNFGCIDVKQRNPKSSEEFDFTNLFNQMELMKERRDFSFKLYDDYKLPINLFAHLYHYHPLELWNSLYYDDEKKLYICRGDIEERKKALSFLSQDNKYIIDPLTLYYLFITETLDYVFEVVGTLYVTESTMDFFTAYDINSKHEPTLETLNHNESKKILGDISSFTDKIKEKCEIIEFLNTLDEENNNKLIAYIPGEAFSDTITAAHYHQMVLVSNDKSFRELAKEIGSINGIWIQLVLMLSKISISKYSEFVYNAMRHQEIFTTTNIFVLIFFSKKEEIEKFKFIASQLCIKNTNMKTTFKLLQDYLIELWYSKDIEEKEYFTNQLINAVTHDYTNVDSNNILQVLLSFNISSEYLRTVRLWIANHFVKL
ncbi:tetratricopeptide repeat protein [Halarcobacter bivalviorum]|uniref:tetratricopeptide repeat protein n=1 Tax=Halarcobacter bivalviorum TaxID=663364 RepID=UPI00100C0B47|nr:hypothetical protein [Halarcobacter bivalviorum]